MSTTASGNCEYGLLSCLVQGVDGWAVSPDLFSHVETRIIYAALEECRKNSEPIDTVSLFRKVADRISFETFSAVVNAVPTTIHYPTFLRDARMALARRKRQFLSMYLMEPNCDHDDMRRLFKEIVQLEETAALESPKKLERHRFDPSRQPPEIRPVFTLKGKVIGSAGNVCVLAAKAKAGKTALIGAMIAASTGLPGDTLHVASANPHGHAVILLDTEQSEADFYRVCRSAFRRVQSEPPPWFWGYSVVPLSLPERRDSLRSLLAMARRNLGGVHSVFMDGVADFVTDPNDAEECFAYIAELHRLAVQYDTTIYTVLHFNPGESYKMRGHLGSQLERKAEVNIAMDKNMDGITTVYTASSRRAPVFKSDGVRFSWSNAHGMHMSHVGAAAVQTTSSDTEF